MESVHRTEALVIQRGGMMRAIRTAVILQIVLLLLRAAQTRM